MRALLGKLLTPNERGLRGYRCFCEDAQDAGGGGGERFSTCVVVDRKSLTGPPFWLSEAVAQSLSPCARPGWPAESKMPIVWVSRNDAEASAITEHGTERLAAKRLEVLAACARSRLLSPAQGIVILLHGTGGSGLDMFAEVSKTRLIAALAERRLKLLCPDARLRKVAHWGGENLNAWFDRGRRADGEFVDTEEHISSECSRLCSLASNSGGRSFIVGLSTGGAMALHAAPRVQPLTGAACFGGWLPRTSPTYKKLRECTRALSILLAYGDADDVVPGDWLRRTAAQVEIEVQRAGGAVDHNVQAGVKHELTEASVSALLDWVDRAAPMEEDDDRM